MKKRAALFHDYPAIDGDVFGGGRREKIAALTDLYPHVVCARNFAEHAAALRDVEVIVATWGMPAFTEAHFAAMPRLAAVFYAAGNVKAFAAPLVERGVVLVSAWAVNAIPTAELVLSQILLTCRGYFRAVRQYAATHELAAAKAFRRTGAAGETIGLIGTGWIARRLTKHLHAFGFRVLASDPFLTPEGARELGVEKVSLEELFDRAYVVSNHVPDLPETKELLGGGAVRAPARGRDVHQQRPRRAGRRGRARARPRGAARSDGAARRHLARAAARRLAAVDAAQRRHEPAHRRHDRRRGRPPRRLRHRGARVAWRAGRPLRYQVTREILATMG